MPPEPTGLGAASLEVFRAFRQAMQLHRRFMHEKVGACDVHPGQAACLNVLVTHDGMSQRDLAAAMHIAAPTLSRMLQKMETAGLIERRGDDADQRLTRVHITEPGRAVMDKLRDALAGSLPAAIEALSLEERRQLVSLLDKLSASIAASLNDLKAEGATERSPEGPAGPGAAT